MALRRTHGFKAAVRWGMVVGLVVATALPAVAGAQVVELRLWHQEQPPYRVQRVQELLDQFNKEHPTIRIRQEVQNWADVYPKILSAIRAGNQPDLIFTIPDFTTVVKATGVVQPLDSLVDELDKAHRFLPSALEPYQYDRHTWAVPLYGMIHNLWYRKDVLDKAGVTPPRTWDELVASAQKLTTAGRYGIGLPANKHLYTDQTIYDLMITAKAEDIFDPSGKLIFDNPRTVRAFTLYRDLWQYSPKDGTGWTWGEAEAAFASAQAAMVFQFTTILTFDKQSGRAPSDLGVLPIPWPADGQRGSIFYSNGVMVLTRDRAKQEAAAAFIRFLLQPEVYGRFLNMEPGLFLPVTEDGSQATSFWQDPLVVKYRPQVQAMVEQSRYGALFGFTKGRVFPAIGPISAQNVLAQTVQKMIVDRWSPQEAVRWGQQQMESLAR
ncbi:MAG: carbohydrate ABC transporter substrate-binding protein [Limnochordaceae bacterium]|nr:carbohydrate ABC transporter substrate-binding protein [Limnochordaceae bacterium]